jgi:hypothetical protein
MGGLQVAAFKRGSLRPRQGTTTHYPVIDPNLSIIEEVPISAFLLALSTSTFDRIPSITWGSVTKLEGAPLSRLKILGQDATCPLSRRGSVRF